MPASKRPLLIGITGNIGSGKSTICKVLEEHGYTVIYADKIAAKYLQSMTDTWVERWGSSILSGGEPDHAKISRIVFAHPQERNFLNAQIHPRVLHEFQCIIDNSDSAQLFFEIPLLFEAELQDSFDYLILITAKRDVVLQRVKQRDKAEYEATLKRLAAQMPDSQKENRVDLVIDNSGSIEASQAQISEFLEGVSRIPFRTVKPLC
jgi:dephospho-CoA kinase